MFVSWLTADRLRPGWPQPSPHGRVYGVSAGSLVAGATAALWYHIAAPSHRRRRAYMDVLVACHARCRDRARLQVRGSTIPLTVCSLPKTAIHRHKKAPHCGAFRALGSN